MIVLKDILYKIPIEKTIGSTAVAVRNIEFDSRNVGLNDVFVAIKGTVSDGHDYILKASEQGALVIICETLPETIINGITYVQVADSHKALAILAANYFENPSENIKLVGITGTNGKTTISTLLYDLFTAAGYKTGLISTVKVMVNDTRYEAKRTTPDSLTINPVSYTHLTLPTNREV